MTSFSFRRFSPELLLRRRRVAHHYGMNVVPFVRPVRFWVESLSKSCALDIRWTAPFWDEASILKSFPIRRLTASRRRRCFETRRRRPPSGRCPLAVKRYELAHAIKLQGGAVQLENLRLFLRIPERYARRRRRNLQCSSRNPPDFLPQIETLSRIIHEHPCRRCIVHMQRELRLSCPKHRALKPEAQTKETVGDSSLALQA